MCILFIAVEQHPEFPLIIAANRDEFSNRPTKPSVFWAETGKRLLAGKDLQAGGTWMGINRDGYIAALTNVRDPQKIMPDATSRGGLVADYLRAPSSDQDYLTELKASANQYNGYNLLYGHWRTLQVFNNHTLRYDKLTPGFYGLSNADLNSPWPKINHGVKALEDYCLEHAAIDEEQLFDLLRNDNRADDQYLPQTGVPIEWERLLSSIFIVADGYGTRSSTVLKIDHFGNAKWWERSFDEKGNYIDQKNYEFSLK